MDVKDKILIKASDLFLRLGFKSVTVDEIALAVGISKKTLYKYFANKEEIILGAVDYVHEEIKTKIQIIFNLNKNAIEENFIIREMFAEMFNSEGNSPVYQLKKHYPHIFYAVREREAMQSQNMFIENMKKGIKEGYYRKDINIEITSQLYYLMIFSINEYFPDEKEVLRLELEALKFYMHSITTENGLKEFTNLYNNYINN